MTRRKMEERHIRRLTKVPRGTSYAVTILIEYIRNLKWRAKQKLEVKLSRDRIIIREWRLFKFSHYVARIQKFK